MSQSSKAAYFKALKEQGIVFDRHYRTYSTDELKASYDALAEARGLPAVVVEVAEPVPARPDEIAEIKDQIAGLGAMIGKLAGIMLADARQPPAPEVKPVPQPAPAKPHPQGLDPLKHAGVTLNTHGVDEPIRVDEAGNQWFQNEVNKPGYAKPRGRRVLRSMDPGVVQQTITTKDGYTETFEIPGDSSHMQQTETKITLPSFQTGIFKAPSMPFKIHVYQGNRGFDWDDVNAYYAGADLVPDTVKRTYVSSDLCYDMTTTIRAIQDEYRERVLKKESIR